MMKFLKYLTIVAISITYSCFDDTDCQECIRMECGFAGCNTEETREVCDQEEIDELVNSSTSNTIWICE